MMIWSFWRCGHCGNWENHQTNSFFPILVFPVLFLLFTRIFSPGYALLACTTAGYALLFSQKTYHRAFLIGLGFCFVTSAIVPMVSIPLMALFFPSKEKREQHIIPIFKLFGITHFSY